ncbi:hypothetical protein S140_10 [Shewanella sp. phage 1/40]|uniref:RIIA lysis inhibitor n=1 Tax=Shewanella sp. phage 1/40 TaxID=1458860 RepID=UPI0004F74410|nr:RIIA lysis inhibitor [Shewanella sp. phage 1/40]AHK11420.1 hypothetical protein S140_10 [Shewanella sp. phage 1/40]
MAIPVAIETEVYQGKSLRSANFGMEFSAKLARTLSSTLYDYKIEACIREYSTNVTDSHNDSGKRGVAGKIHLPTQMEPWFEAEDFGLGMTEDTIYSIFTVYGKSTKEEDNSTNGCLGYGSKVGFSVGDQFTITSVKDGAKSIVVCYKDRTGLPTADTKSITTTTESNGTKIRVPIDTKDISKWHLNGARVLGAFETQHEVNTFGAYEDEYTATRNLCTRVREETSVYLDKRSVGHFNHRDTRFVLMGDVLYSIPSWGDLVRCKSLSTISDDLTSDGVYITHFGIGECDFAPSRESLSLDQQTFNKVSKRITCDIIKYYRNLMKEVGSSETASWYLFYKKFRGTSVWDALKDYPLPFTGGYALKYTNTSSYTRSGYFDGYKIKFLTGKMTNVSGIVPTNHRSGGVMFSNSVENLHQERISRMDNIILVYSEKEKGLKDKKNTLFNIQDVFPDSDTILYCPTEDTLSFAKTWFGVSDEMVLCGDSYVKTKPKTSSSKTKRGGYGITDDRFTVANVIDKTGTNFTRVDLTDADLFYVSGDSGMNVKCLDGEVVPINFGSHHFNKLENLGVTKVIITNKNNEAKVKRYGVKDLGSHISAAVADNRKCLVKTKLSRQYRNNLNFSTKVDTVLPLLKATKKFTKYMDKIESSEVASTLLSISDFRVTKIPTYTKMVDKVDKLQNNVRLEIESVKSKLPLWDKVHGDDFKYYLKLEKFIK